MRGSVAIAGLGTALVVCLGATVAAAQPAAPAATLPLWIDPQLLGAAPAAAPAATPDKPRFTVTRVTASGARVTEAIDATALQALGRPAAAAPPALAAVSAPATPPAVARAKPEPSPSTAALIAAARRPAVEPTWTALARRTLAASALPAPLAALAPSPAVAKAEGKALPFGVRDGRRYGETGRVYLYAAMKNKGLGMNVVDRGEAWGGDGVSYDQGGFAGQRSAGIGWRRGEVSTSLGWVHEKNRINGVYGAPAEKDDRVAVTFSWRPQVAKSAPPLAAAAPLPSELAAR